MIYGKAKQLRVLRYAIRCRYGKLKQSTSCGAKRIRRKAECDKFYSLNLFTAKLSSFLFSSKSRCRPYSISESNLTDFSNKRRCHNYILLDPGKNSKIHQSPYTVRTHTDEKPLSFFVYAGIATPLFLRGWVLLSTFWPPFKDTVFVMCGRHNLPSHWLGGEVKIAYFDIYHSYARRPSVFATRFANSPLSEFVFSVEVDEHDVAGTQQDHI